MWQACAGMSKPSSRVPAEAFFWVPAKDAGQATFELLARHRMPTVTFLRRSGKRRFDHVGIENAAATRTATSYLAELGHEHIAYLGGVAQFGVRTERIRSYVGTIGKLGLAGPIVWDTADDRVAGLQAMTCKTPPLQRRL